MPFTTPTSSQFRARFTEFADEDKYTNAQINSLLAEAEGGVGTDWAERDYQPALLYLAAHYLQAQTDQRASIAATSSSGSTDGLGMVKSITTGNRTVTFETKAAVAGSGSSSSDVSDFESTFYGQQYLRLLRRNVSGIMTLNAG